MNEKIIYHFVKPTFWQSQIENNIYFSETFLTEKFIHASIREQLQATANRYYKGYDSMILLHIDTTLLTSELKYEMSESLQQLFPHIYGGINKNSIVISEILTKNLDESWEINK